MQFIINHSNTQYGLLWTNSKFIFKYHNRVVAYTSFAVELKYSQFDPTVGIHIIIYLYRNT